MSDEEYGRIVKSDDEEEKLERFYGGIKHMKGMPAAIFVVDPKKEESSSSALTKKIEEDRSWYMFWR